MADLVIASEELINYLQHKDSNLDVVQEFDGNLVIDKVISVNYYRFDILDRNRDALHFNYNSYEGSKFVLATVEDDPDYGIENKFYRGEPRKFQLGNWRIIDRPVSDCSSTKPTDKSFESVATPVPVSTESNTVPGTALVESTPIPETKAEHLTDSQSTSEYNPMGSSHDFLTSLINGPRGATLVNIALLGFMKDIKTQLDKMETDIADIKTHLVEASNRQ